MVEPPPDPKRQRLDEEEVDEGAEAVADEADAHAMGSIYPAELGVDESIFEQYGGQQEFLDKVRSDRILGVFDLDNSSLGANSSVSS
jgi:hypothetical protein